MHLKASELTMACIPKAAQNSNSESEMQLGFFQETGFMTCTRPFLFDLQGGLASGNCKKHLGAASPDKGVLTTGASCYLHAGERLQRWRRWSRPSAQDYDKARGIPSGQGPRSGFHRCPNGVPWALMCSHRSSGLHIGKAWPSRFFSFLFRASFFGSS